MVCAFNFLCVSVCGVRSEALKKGEAKKRNDASFDLLEKVILDGGKGII